MTRIQRKFALAEKCTPLILLTTTVTTKNLFHRPMKPLGQAITLRMVTRTHSNSTIKQTHKMLPKLTLETSITITHYLGRHTMSTNPMLKEQQCHILRRTSSQTRNKSNHTRKTINNSKDAIIAPRRHRKVCHKVHGHMLKTSSRILNRF